MTDHLRINLTYAEAWVLHEAMRDYVRDYRFLPDTRRPGIYSDEPPQAAHLLLALAERTLHLHRLNPNPRKGLN
jgi:hypothetical protein